MKNNSRRSQSLIQIKLTLFLSLPRKSKKSWRTRASLIWNLVYSSRIQEKWLFLIPDHYLTLYHPFSLASLLNTLSPHFIFKLLNRRWNWNKKVKREFVFGKILKKRVVNPRLINNLKIKKSFYINWMSCTLTLYEFFSFVYLHDPWFLGSLS